MKYRLGIGAAALVAFILLPGSAASAKPDHCGCGNSASIPNNESPDWSPDGRRIVFSHSADSGRELWVMNADGSKQHVLLRAKGDENDPDWSPDGRRIAFTAYRNDNYDIYVMNADGTGVTRLTTDGATDGEPDWSPDGRSIAFGSSRVGDKGQIWVMDADGGNQRRLFADEDYDVDPTWSPDGSKIAFEGGLDESYVDVVSSNGTGRVRLTIKGGETSPAWSPDGSQILFKNYVVDSEDLYIMNADGSDQRFLFGDPESSERDPAWSPDGRSIALSSSLDGTRQIYVVHADGNGSKRLTGVRRAYTSTGERCTIVGTSGRTSSGPRPVTTTSAASASTTRSWVSPARTSSTAAP
jgi:Tol biopolymer transport system component